MHPSIVLAVFPVIFLGELPDKTMFASLVLGTRGHPRAVWLGAASAFLVHVVIATTIGVGLFHLVPHRALEAVVAALFLGGAIWALLESSDDEIDLIERESMTHRQVATTAFAVIFVAEWGDLTQILTANLAAHYHSALSVGLGATLALWSVALIAVVGGQGLMRWVNVRMLRRGMAAILMVLAIITAVSAIRG
ncbi:MAG TPA: TMEM165/GDT1 family protein [Acidimicrobiia bacterium]|nr:TMEM165/GDT1 family protein [Acidimicrobiia bacterium]